jgi:hypothetical protein
MLVGPPEPVLRNERNKVHLVPEPNSELDKAIMEDGVSTASEEDGSSKSVSGTNKPGQLESLVTQPPKPATKQTRGSSPSRPLAIGKVRERPWVCG